MSWAEVFKINSNMTKPLNILISELISGVTTQITNLANSVTSVNTNVTNTKTQVGSVSTQVTNVGTQVSNVNTAVGNVNTKLTQMSTQMRDSRFLPMKIITSTGTYTPEKTGTYKVICVGAGGDGSTNSSSYQASGGGGGVAIKTLRLLSTTAYNVTVSTTASFAYGNTAITATSGGTGSARNAVGGTGGTASGGDYNYSGENGEYVTSTKGVPLGGSVGVFISELTIRKSNISSVNSKVVELHYGDSILGYGGGGSASVLQDADNEDVSNPVNGLPAAVIIIPLELEG
jgi:hypothetical protein